MTRKTIALSLFSAGVGGVVGRLASRHADEGMRRVGTAAGVVFGLAALCFVGFIVWAVQEGKRVRTSRSQTSSDWREINAELAEGATRLSAKTWLMGSAVGLGITAEVMVLTRSSWWLAAAPAFIAVGWLSNRATAEELKRSASPMDEPTKRFWGRVRSP